MSTSLDHLRDLSSNLSKENKKLTEELVKIAKVAESQQKQIKARDLEIANLTKQVSEYENSTDEKERKTKFLKDALKRQERELASLKKSSGVMVGVIMVLFIAVFVMYYF